MNRQLPRQLAVYALCVLSLTPAFARSASAAIITTGSIVETSQRAAHLQRVERALSNQQLRQALTDYGVAPQAIEERLAGLSDSELVSLADTLEQAPAGGELFGLLGVIFVVLLVLELVGVIDVFKAVGPARR
jgi:hypothetical protein